MKPLRQEVGSVGPSKFANIAPAKLSLEAFAASAPAVSLYRLKQVLARIPVSRSAWFAGIHTGRYPRSYSLGPRTTVWRSDDIDKVVASICHSAYPAAADGALLQGNRHV